MALTRSLKLIQLKSYEGRHRTYKKSTGAIKNSGSEVIYEPFTITETSVQPISGRTIYNLPDGYKDRAVYQFWTEQDLVSLQFGTDKLSDQIKIGEEWFSIYTRKDWTRTDFLVHNHCIAIREDTKNKTGGNFG